LISPSGPIGTFGDQSDDDEWWRDVCDDEELDQELCKMTAEVIEITELLIYLGCPSETISEALQGLTKMLLEEEPSLDIECEGVKIHVERDRDGLILETDPPLEELLKDLE